MGIIDVAANYDGIYDAYPHHMCGGGGIVGKHVWVTVVACTCMLS